MQMQSDLGDSSMGMGTIPALASAMELRSGAAVSDSLQWDFQSVPSLRRNTIPVLQSGDLKDCFEEER